MSLRIESIRFQDFRSYDSFELEGLAGLTVLVGPNAAGKTNAMEGIQLMTAFGSFRNPRAVDLVRWGCESARLSCRLVSDARDLRLSADIRPGARTYRLNGKKKAVGELQGLLPSVAFSPDDLALVKGAQAGRRAALDLLGCQLSKNHRIIKHDFERLVKHKNALLKDDAPALLVESVNDMLRPAAVSLYRYRAALAANLAARMADAYAAIAEDGEQVEVAYVPSWESDEARHAASAAPMAFSYTKEEADEAMARALAARLAEERVRKRAVVGPHHDRVEFFIDGRNASLFASQGQQRSLVLAWKVAEVGIIREMSGAMPVLLLDDVMSELDARRRRALVGLISGGGQTFITATDTSYFERDLLDGAKVLTLEGGARWAR